MAGELPCSLHWPHVLSEVTSCTCMARLAQMKSLQYAARQTVHSMDIVRHFWAEQAHDQWRLPCVHE